MSKRKFTRLPASPCDWAWRSTGDEYGSAMDAIRNRLGIKDTKIPRDMHGTYRMDGWDIVVKRGAPKGSPKSAKHRIFVRYNGELVPAGRVAQALCKPTVHRARKRAAKRRGAKGRFEGRRKYRRR